jgi:hypothetical protein
MWFKRFSRAMALGGLSLFILINQAVAQSETPKFEVGAQFSLLRFGRINPNLTVTDPGVGVRVIWNINDYLSAEAEFNYYAERDENAARGGRKIQGLFGVKAGKRSDHFGVFAKFRPGFIDFDKRLVRCPPGAICPAVIRYYSKTEAAFDAGGVVEFYPSRSTTVRIDLGDTIIRFRDPGYPTQTTHNLQFSAGFGFRF